MIEWPEKIFLKTVYFLFVFLPLKTPLDQQQKFLLREITQLLHNH